MPDVVPKATAWLAPAGRSTVTAAAGSRGFGEQSARGVDQPTLVGVGQLPADLRQRDPGDLVDLDVGIGQLATDASHEVVPDRLVDTPALGHEPEVDGAEFGQDLA